MLIQLALAVPASPLPGPYCVEILGRRPGRVGEVVETAAGRVTLRCDRESRKAVSVCLEMDPANWPEHFPEQMSCTVGRLDLEVYPYEAWDPAWVPGTPLWLRTTGTRLATYTFDAPEGAWRAAEVAPARRHLACSLTGERLQVELFPGVEPGPATCVLTGDDGASERVEIRVEVVDPVGGPR